jgi:hypothetical protein
MEVETGRKQG